jgi:hypothetical protein
VNWITDQTRVNDEADKARAPQNSDAAETGSQQTVRDGQHDFDFNIGAWKSHLSRLLHPLTGSTTWVEFDGEQHMDNINQLTADASGREIWEWWCKRATARGITTDMREQKGAHGEGACAKCIFHSTHRFNAEFEVNKCPVSGIRRIMSKEAAEEIALKDSPLFISDICLTQLLSTYSFNEDHVAHVAAYSDKPGLVASYLVPTPESAKILDVQVFLMDGTHRAVHDLRTGVSDQIPASWLKYW